MTTINDRLTSAENDVNRLLELLQELVTVEDVSTHVKILDNQASEILNRIFSLEKKISSLKYKWQQAHKRSQS